MTKPIQFRIKQRHTHDGGISMLVEITQKRGDQIHSIILDGIEPGDAIEMQKEIWHSIKNHTGVMIDFIE